MSVLKGFFKIEALSGILLIVFAIFAMLIKNSDWSNLYQNFLMMTVEIRAESFSIQKPLLLWINDGIMAIFFFVIGLELKQELLVGKLRNIKTLLLPVVAAIGGILVPAAIYLFINKDNQLSAHGWAIPTATDIAFALGILALLGDKVPASLKLFLMTLAIIDDLAGILVIALLYTDSLSVTALSLALVGFIGLFTLNRLNVTRIAPYLLFGLFIWVCFLKSGVHATIAGVVNALFIPLSIPKNKDDLASTAQSNINTSQHSHLPLTTHSHGSGSPLSALLHNLHPYVALGVLPLFAFANAGVDLGQVKFENIFSGVPVGIFLGLFVGKQLGVFSFSFIAIKLGLCRLPEKANWLQLYGTSILCGIGFTMSLFIASLAFAHGGAGEARVDRLAILVGSVLSAIVGFAVLKFASSTATENEAN